MPSRQAARRHRIVNGTKIADFKGQAPPKGGPPGVYAESGSAGVTWVFPRVQLF